MTWTHYCELLSISDADKRSFYEKEAVNSGWSVREMKRQMATSLYERLLLSDGNIFASRYTCVIPNKEELIAQVEAVLKEWHDPQNEN